MLIADLDPHQKEFVLIMFANTSGLKVEAEEEYGEIFNKDEQLVKAMNKRLLVEFINYDKSASFGWIHFPDDIQSQKLILSSPIIPF